MLIPDEPLLLTAGVAIAFLVSARNLQHEPFQQTRRNYRFPFVLILLTVVALQFDPL